MMYKVEVKKQRSLEALTGEVGKSGTVIVDGYIMDVDYNTDFDGGAGLEKYQKMLTDTTVKMCIDTIELGILSTQWTVEGKRGEKWEQELFRELGTPWQEVLRGLLPYRYGVALAEVVYRADELKKGRLVVEDIKVRQTDTVNKWVTDIDRVEGYEGELPDKGLLGIEQVTLNNEKAFIPRVVRVGDKWVPKLLVIVNSQRGENYWGESDLRAVYREWYFKDKLIKFHGLMSEKLATPMMYAIVSPRMSPEDKEAIKEALKNARANQARYIYLESEKDQVAEVGFVDMKVGSLSNALEDSEVYSRRIAEAMDLNWKTDQGKGSEAKDRVRYEDFIKRENSRLIFLEEQLNRQLVGPIEEFNNGEVGDVRLVAEKLEARGISEAMQTIGELVGKGALTVDEELENKIRHKLGFEDIEGVDKETQETFIRINEELKNNRRGETKES